MANNTLKEACVVKCQKITLKKRITNRLKFIQNRRALIAIGLLVVSFAVPWAVARYNLLGIDADASISAFGVAATVVGALLVVFELKDNERVDCCAMLADMNMKFIENERLMLVYRELCECVRNPQKELIIDDEYENMVHSSDLMAYMTFYEVINEYIKKGIIDIAQMDDLFGDRFFKLIHNQCVQERELYAEPSSYVNIFQLYNMWWQHRVAQAEDKSRLVVLEKNAIPQLYLEKNLYMYDTVQFFDRREVELSNSAGERKTFTLKRLLPYHLEQVEKLQDLVVDRIQKKEIFAPSTKDEVLESMLIDYCYGLFDEERLAAVCICVLNRSTIKTGDHERNLCVLTENEKDFADYVTFDTIQVHPNYRGFGIQRFFLKEAEKVAHKVKAKHLIATVSPDNPYSKNMFVEAQYEIYGGKEIAAYDSVRYLMIKRLTEEYDG